MFQLCLPLKCKRGGSEQIIHHFQFFFAHDLLRFLLLTHMSLMRGLWLQHARNLATEDSSTTEESIFLFKHCQSKIATDIPQETELGPMSNKNSKFKPAFKKQKKLELYIWVILFLTTVS